MISELIGATLEKIGRLEGNERLEFTTVTGDRYAMYHSQDCCESVQIIDIVGDLGDLIGTPILAAEESVNPEDPKPELPEDVYGDDSQTWTFYRFSTIKGTVVVRWFGSSNGYYSESVDFVKVSG